MTSPYSNYYIAFLCFSRGNVLFFLFIHLVYINNNSVNICNKLCANVAIYIFRIFLFIEREL